MIDTEIKTDNEIAFDNKIAIDTEAVRSGIAQKEKQLSRINENLPTILAFLKTHGHEGKLKSLKSYNDILNLFKPDYPFPKAGDAENLKLLGINVKGIEDASKCLSAISSDFIVKDGIATISKKWHDLNIENRTAKAHTDAECRTLEYARRLSALINEGVSKGYLDNRTIWTKTRSLGLFSTTDTGETIFSVNGIREHAKKEVV